MAGDELSLSLDEDLEQLVSSKKLEPMHAVQVQTLRDIQQLAGIVIEDDAKKNVQIKIRPRRKSEKRSSGD